MAEVPHKKRVWLSWSSGKDCAYTLHTLRTQYVDTYDVVGLLTTFNETADRVAMHAVRGQLLRMQAAAAGLPVHEVMLPSPCTNEEYNTRMAAALATAKEAGVEAIAFGDLFLEEVRAYREMNMRNSGIDAIFPIWLAGTHKTTKQLASEMMSAGLKAVLTCVDPKRMPKELVGRFWDQNLLQDLPEDVDPCGENGEFHTFAFEGPMFKQALDIQVGQIVERDGFCFCDVVPPGMSLDAAAAEVAVAAAEAAARAAAATTDTSVAAEDDTDCRKMIQLALQEKRDRESQQQPMVSEIGAADSTRGPASVPA